MTDVVFSDVELRDGRKILYQGLNFTLSGGLNAVYGPSRTGKSSILLLASGHLAPTAGRVLIDGKRPDRRRAGLGPIHDLTPLFDTLSVQETILFQARLHKVRQPKARVAELIAQYDLHDVRSYRVKDLAHLEQFRTGLATALVHRPDLILIDEPERGLTNEEWEVAHGDLLRLTRDGHTVLMTTVLAQVADRCATVIELPGGEVRSA
ncbi:ATP-binding cassette domain-containing protein [Tumebacillus sp. DT12]|uniref:ATP-binding cassette domain-containing protein n=1 Tax=Tumebacillus lacus TaxID=2995335 RepID=A0ABT3X153_9BACL|nr:ATP-binding cassette domain-containing protein [Tumebacillus lacus]MCX7570630.1 ATP-binding cassette domain-containing protein [Tumebacillus lacus]